MSSRAAAQNGCGSPPRVRGKPADRRRSRPGSRITPARAGKTFFLRLCLARSWDHPRACGENNVLTVNTLIAFGSPPRVRGKRLSSDVFAPQLRITPARAGKTRSRARRNRCGRDHPRACGENGTGAGGENEKSGSPPRVRGKLGLSSLSPGSYRITPARAGKTIMAVSISCAAADHPRACGENADGCCIGWGGWGSPPRVRGKLVFDLGNVNVHRITPARAGKTSTGMNCPSSGSDHPRACGENNGKPSNMWQICGSPPRVRGKH